MSFGMGNMISKLQPLRLGTAALLIAAFNFALHLYAGRYYGYFVDELYNLSLARHLDWGYVDVAPMIALLTRVEVATFGDSLSAIRLLPAMAGAVKILLTAGLTHELGGGRFAQALAALCCLTAPGFLALDHFLNVNSFEALVWIGLAWLLVRIIRTGNSKLWLWFGVLAGVGLETKHSVLLFGFALVAGLAISPARRRLASPWLLVGGVIAFLLFLPNLLWNIQHHFPFLELQENIRRDGRNVAFNPLSFFGQETLAMLPATLPVWLAGLWYLLFHRDGRHYAALAWAFIIASALILTMNPRVYYLFPAFPMLFAAGSVAIERWRVRWIRPVLCVLLVAMGALIAPTMLPVLSPETYIRYVHATGLEQPRVENHDSVRCRSSLPISSDGKRWPTPSRGFT
jgi:4-amino-4-deoxy-L-arabinose transferase-like glycosyltransferase